MFVVNEAKTSGFPSLSIIDQIDSFQRAKLIKDTFQMNLICERAQSKNSQALWLVWILTSAVVASSVGRTARIITTRSSAAMRGIWTRNWTRDTTVTTMTRMGGRSRVRASSTAMSWTATIASLRAMTSGRGPWSAVAALDSFRFAKLASGSANKNGNFKLEMCQRCDWSRKVG